jgi:hypothetical protein
MNHIVRLGIPAALALSLVACASDRKHARSAESNAPITETSTQPDMPPAASGTAEPGAKASAKDEGQGAPASGAAQSGAAGGMIAVAPMRMVPSKKGKTEKEFELKDDGTVSIDGKAAAKFSGDQLQTSRGMTLVTVGVDGSLVGNALKPGFKFEGDDLVNESGAKLAVGDDGNLTSTTKDGKTETVAKIEGGAKAKRAALIVAAVWMAEQGAAGAGKAKADSKGTKASAAKK